MPVRRKLSSMICRVVPAAESVTEDDELDYEYAHDELNPEIVAMLLARSAAPLVGSGSVEEAIQMLGLDADVTRH